MSGSARRWSPCPWCGAASETLFARLRCTGAGCRWYDESAYLAWAAEPPAGVPWVWAAAPEEGA